MIAARLAVKKYALALARGRFFHRQPSPFRGRLARSFGKTTIFTARNEDDLWLETYDVVLVLQKLGFGNILVAFLFFLHILRLYQYGVHFTLKFLLGNLDNKGDFCTFVYEDLD